MFGRSLIDRKTRPWGRLVSGAGEHVRTHFDCRPAALRPAGETHDMGKAGITGAMAVSTTDSELHR